MQSKQGVAKETFLPPSLVRYRYTLELYYYYFGGEEGVPDRDKAVVAKNPASRRRRLVERKEK